MFFLLIKKKNYPCPGRLAKEWRWIRLYDQSNSFRRAISEIGPKTYERFLSNSDVAPAPPPVPTILLIFRFVVPLTSSLNACVRLCIIEARSFRSYYLLLDSYAFSDFSTIRAEYGIVFRGNPSMAARGRLYTRRSFRCRVVYGTLRTTKRNCAVRRACERARAMHTGSRKVTRPQNPPGAFIEK